MKWTPPDDFGFPSFLDVSNKSKRYIQSIQKETSMTQWTILAGTAVTCFAAGFSIGRLPPLFRRFPTVMDIPKEHFAGTRWFRGRVISVTDGDTMRVLHVPTILHSATVPTRKVSDSTWSIRICTIDAPETAKFGNSGQKYGQVAKEHLQTLFQDKFVQIRLLERDQYGRAVAEVRKLKFMLYYQYADELMLKAGLAEVYQGSAAVYGRLGKEAYVTLQNRAQTKKIGMWKEEQRESAAEYKARTKQ